MAGGIYDGQPFELNETCVMFSGALVAAYWYLPCRYDPQKYTTSAFIAASSYVALAWYDKTYQCKNRLKHNPGLFNMMTGWAKPPVNRATGTY